MIKNSGPGWCDSVDSAPAGKPPASLDAPGGGSEKLPVGCGHFELKVTETRSKAPTPTEKNWN